MGFAGGEWALTLKNLFVPMFCKQCGLRLLTEENGHFCPTCWEMSPRIERPYCPVCGRPHAPGIGYGARDNTLCGPCSAEKAERPYRFIFGAAVYDGAIGEAIRLFKFYGKRRLARPLGEVMRTAIESELECEPYQFVIPVPLYKVRLRERGYNQSALLAREVMSCFPNARLDESLKRIRPTLVQSRLTDPAQRRDNVRGAFAVDNAAHLQEAAVVLVDDVVTTGGTVHECAETLRRAGVASVDVVAAALALPHAATSR
ncbi:MAG: double zinc ribbon domain-containing protein [Candidatus Hydrogenedentes bacterium]|nr:double zinc ribbon domain-containing protein [Candidatus Hydrogenedentota bacterium]